MVASYQTWASKATFSDVSNWRAVDRVTRRVRGAQQEGLLEIRLHIVERVAISFLVKLPHLSAVPLLHMRGHGFAR